MPRSPRLLLSKSYYHIMTRGNNRNVVFRSDDDYRYYLSLVERFKAEHPFDLFHFCLMPSHTHFQVGTNKASDLSVFMKRLNLAYFHHYRQGYGWVGHFWQDRFKSQPIGKDNYFIQCGKYIELNPVRSGLVVKPEDYKYSSYSFYAQGAKSSLLAPDMFYEDLGGNDTERRMNYQKMVIDDIVISNYQKPVWGSPTQRYNEVKKIGNHLGAKA